MRFLQPPTVMSAPGAFSQGVAAKGSLVFVSGQVSVDKDANLIGEGDMAAQTRQALANVERVLAEAGAELTDVVATTVYLSSYDDYSAFDRAYGEVFGGHRPARATVRADLVLASLLVEIQATAVISE